MFKDRIQIIFSEIEKMLAFYMIKIKSPSLLLGKHIILEDTNFGESQSGHSVFPFAVNANLVPQELGTLTKRITRL